jgi:hypothetical protein
MATPDRLVRRLRLQAGSADDVAHVLPVLEDALRCASLPDAGGRLLLVRRLALGRLARNATPQALSRLIEERVAQADAQWVPGGTAAAGGAGFVCFTGRLDACTQAALRLLRGQACSEWYWPLAVPELRAAASAAEGLQRIARAVAGWPEARHALPAWAAALVRAGVGPRLAAAIGEPLGEALLAQAGVAMRGSWGGPAVREPADGPHVQVVRLGPGRQGAGQGPAAAAEGGDAPGPRAAAGALGDAPGEPQPRWLHSLLQAAGEPVPVQRRSEAGLERARTASRPAARAEPAPQGGESIGPSTALPWREGPRVLHGSVPAERGEVAAAPPLLVNPVLPAAAAPLAAPLHAGPLHEGEPLPEAAELKPPTRPATPAPGTPPLRVEGEATAFGGLLFLLPVLARLGLAQWLDHAGPEAAIPQRILAAALQRLRAAPGDAAWWLAPCPAVAAPVRPVPAPARWHDPMLATVLRTPRGAVPATDLPQALAAASSADAQAAVWLAAARRWLRRAGRIGLASLVCRPGRLCLTPTHADLLFGLDDSDMRVRRQGLDIDPGWLPWYGRVVGFHYERGVLV